MKRSILITGGGRRIGRALALGLAGDGWSVAVHYGQSAEAAQEVAEEIAAGGGCAVILAADLADAGAVEKLVAEADDALAAQGAPPLGALINNASIFENDTAASLDAAQWDAHQNINLRAPALLMRDFAKREAAEGGAIINIIDQRVWRLTPNFLSYTVSKTGLWTLTQTFAQSLAAQGIRVNAIGPGPVLPAPYQTQAQFDRQAEAVPLGRGASPEEIVEAARYILAAPSMTGQMIALDGGQHLAWRTPDADS